MPHSVPITGGFWDISHTSHPLLGTPGSTFLHLSVGLSTILLERTLSGGYCEVGTHLTHQEPGEEGGGPVLCRDHTVLTLTSSIQPNHVPCGLATALCLGSRPKPAFGSVGGIKH